ncbi:hypothetical protein D9M69_607800 [compost metagenome]
MTCIADARLIRGLGFNQVVVITGFLISQVQILQTLGFNQVVVITEMLTPACFTEIRPTGTLPLFRISDKPMTGS